MKNQKEQGIVWVDNENTTKWPQYLLIAYPFFQKQFDYMHPIIFYKPGSPGEVESKLLL